MKTLMFTLRMLLCAVIFSLFTAEASAQLIKTQAPCTPVLGSGNSVPQADRYCFNFNAGDPIPIVRAITFNAPSAGTALVSFNGSMTCSSFNSTTFTVTDFASQIVTNVNATANVAGPSGLRHGLVLLPNAAGTSDSFNLASARSFNFKKAGPKNFYFKLAVLRMDAGTTCYVYNSTISVIFVP